MGNVLDLIVSTLTQGFVYSLLSYGVYITYKILDFPDLTVDGSFPLGAAVTAVLLTKGVDPYLAIPIVIAVGALAELIEEPTDILILGSKPGLVDHQLAASLNTRAVLASGPLALTTKALATLTTAGCVIVPDFLSLGGPLLGFAAERDGQPVDLNAIRATTAAAAPLASQRRIDVRRTPVHGSPLGTPPAPDRRRSPDAVGARRRQ